MALVLCASQLHQCFNAAAAKDGSFPRPGAYSALRLPLQPYADCAKISILRAICACPASMPACLQIAHYAQAIISHLIPQLMHVSAAAKQT